MYCNVLYKNWIYDTNKGSWLKRPLYRSIDVCSHDNPPREALAKLSRSPLCIFTLAGFINPTEPHGFYSHLMKVEIKIAERKASSESCVSKEPSPCCGNELYSELVIACSVRNGLTVKHLTCTRCLPRSLNSIDKCIYMEVKIVTLIYT